MSLLRINPVSPGVKRPFRLADIQEVWNGLDDALSKGETTPVIISGFIQSGSSWGAGVVAFGGKLYLHPNTGTYTIPVGSNVYGGEVPSGDVRVFEDSSQHDVYFNRIAGTDSTLGTLIGNFNASNVMLWKSRTVNDLSITNAKIAERSITYNKIALNTITNAEIANSTIIQGLMASGSVGTAQIIDSNVTTAKIADSNVTTAKIANLNVTTDKIAANAVTTEKINTGAVTANELSTNAVTTVKILDSNVTTAKIADSNVTTAKIADLSITNAKLVAGSVTGGETVSSKIANQTIVSYNLAAGLQPGLVRTGYVTLTTTGGTASVVFNPMSYANSSVTISGNSITFFHNIGVSNLSVILQVYSTSTTAGPYVTQITAISPTSVTMLIRDTTNGAAITSGVTIHYFISTPFTVRP